MGVDVSDDLLNPIRGDMGVELSVLRATEEAGDQICVRSADERPQRWLRNQGIPPIAAYLSSAKQLFVSVVAYAGIQICRNFDDYIRVESAEWTKGVFQLLDIGGCPA